MYPIQLYNTETGNPRFVVRFHNNKRLHLRRLVIGMVITICIAQTAEAQSVTEIITDFNGYWKSSGSNINTVKPNNSHNLVAFNYNGIRYSTGVNDALLTSRGDAFIAMDMRALPVHSIANKVTSNTKIGLGYLYDGNPNGSSVVPPVNQLNHYLVDGKNGLDIGTGVANLPAGTISFEVTDLKLNYVGDGIPDILVTQIADPSGSTDKYEFLDENGKRVGNIMNISFNHITPIGHWTADFYEASNNPMTLTPGFTTTDRPLRLWAADFSDFGITASNISSIRTFQINLSGNSDVAFVGYNFKTLMVVLPVELKSFHAALKHNDVSLNWSTAEEKDNSHFIIEKSDDLKSFTQVATIRGKGASAVTRIYSYTDKEVEVGKWFYRLKIVDNHGKFTYSEIKEIESKTASVKIKLYPNPASGDVNILHPLKSGVIEIRNTQGALVAHQVINGSTRTNINISSLKPGLYQVSITGTNYFQSGMMIVK